MIGRAPANFKASSKGMQQGSNHHKKRLVKEKLKINTDRSFERQTGLGTAKNIQDKKILKFLDIFQDIKPRKHAEKVPLKLSKNTVVTQNQ